MGIYLSFATVLNIFLCLVELNQTWGKFY